MEEKTHDDREIRIVLGTKAAEALEALARAGRLEGADLRGWVDLDGDVAGGLGFRTGGQPGYTIDPTRAASQGVIRGVIRHVSGKAPPIHVDAHGWCHVGGNIFGGQHSEAAALVHALASLAPPPTLADEFEHAIASRPVEGLDGPLLARVVAALREAGK